MAGRLTNVQYPSGMTEVYTYDRAGNRITLTNSITGTTYYTYDGENKLIYTNHSGDITKYAYDGMGNTISGGGSTTMTYDYERRLTSITLPSGDTVTYLYLPNGDRISRQNGTSIIFYLYDREDRIADYDTNGNLMIAYTHGPGVDKPVAMSINGSTYFYIPDIQGSIRAIVDTSGNLMASYVYDVWGNLISHNGPLSEKNDYLYTGREYDWETGIYYYRYRYYNPEIGRFIQSSWELNEEMNMYVYVNNDPVKGMDPTGHPYRPPVLVDHGTGGAIGPGGGQYPGPPSPPATLPDCSNCDFSCLAAVDILCSGAAGAVGTAAGLVGSPVAGAIAGMITAVGCIGTECIICAALGKCDSSQSSQHTSGVDVIGNGMHRNIEPIIEPILKIRHPHLISPISPIFIKDIGGVRL